MHSDTAELALTNTISYFMNQVKYYVKIAREEGGTVECGEGKDAMPELPEENKNVCAPSCQFSAF